MPQYPETWDEYIGQKDAVEQLRLRIAAAQARGAQPEHILIHSRIAGAGKTALGQLVARQLRVPMTIASDPIKPEHVPFLFKRLVPGQVLLLDEFHRWLATASQKAKSEWLLPYMADGVIPTATGRGARQAPPLTIIATTTDVARITTPFMSRFDMQLPLKPYSEDEAQQIAANMAPKILHERGGALPLPSAAVCGQIARAGSCNPREIGRILKALRDDVWGQRLTPPADGEYDLAQTLAWAGFTPDGLNAQEQEYLLLLWRAEAPVAEVVLRDKFGKGDGFRELETALVDKGLMERTKQGRILTDKGLDRAEELTHEGTTQAA